MKAFGIALVAYTAAVLVLAMLLVRDVIGTIAFWSLLAVSTAALFVPLMKIGGTEARISDNVLNIKAPMVDLSIPLSAISSIECRDSFKPGLRMFGYGGIKRGYGDFTNDEFSSYIYAGDSRIPRFIVIGYGRGKVAVFNYKDGESTEELYRQITAGSDAASAAVPRTNVAEKHSRMKLLTLAITGIAVIVTVAIVAIMLSSGHVDVRMNDDSITIDATMMKEDIRYEDVMDLELRDDFNAGTRIGGYGTHKFSSGNFKNDEFGRYRLAMHNDVNSVIVIHLSDKIVVFNMDSDEKTSSAYYGILERIQPKTYSESFPCAPQFI